MSISNSIRTTVEADDREHGGYILRQYRQGNSHPHTVWLSDHGMEKLFAQYNKIKSGDGTAGEKTISMQGEGE